MSLPLRTSYFDDVPTVFLFNILINKLNNVHNKGVELKFNMKFKTNNLFSIHKVFYLDSCCYTNYEFIFLFNIGKLTTSPLYYKPRTNLNIVTYFIRVKLINLHTKNTTVKTVPFTISIR